jgi:methyl-accepting chemotaxis protein-1 (serine sensor receptor)
MKLKHKIPLVFLLITVLVAATGLLGIYRLSQSLTVYQTAVQVADSNERMVEDMLYQFKVQVQEWKDTLLRGKDPAKLQKYWGNFEQREHAVDDLAAKLLTTLSNGESRVLVENFISAHSKMGEGYRKGFEAFKAANFESSVGDAAVAGVDRAPSQLLVDAAKKISFENQTLVEQTAKDSHRAVMIALFLMVGVAVLAVGGGIVFSRRILLPLSRATKIAETVASGDLTSSIVLDSDDEIGQLLTALSHMNDRLVTLVQAVRSGSQSVATASAEIAQGNNDLSARTESQASFLEETAASMEELNSTVKQNAEAAKQASQLATNASTVAQQGGDVVGQVVETMKGINDASRKINEIISVIDGIAFQTNILALNAAVEAARAGEQGRGFAVVASEVRLLAGRSAEAAKEIKSLIGASVERVEQGTALVDKAGGTMAEIVSSIRRVTDIVSEISAAGNEQASGVAQVGEAVSSMDQVTQQNAALVEEMAAAASSLKSQAQDLVQVVAVFKLNEGDDVAKVAVRSATPKSFPGDDRRIKQGRPVAAKATAKPVSPAKAPSLPKPVAAPKQSAAAQDDEWETF